MERELLALKGGAGKEVWDLRGQFKRARPERADTK